ncbi:MAG: DUF971 domain-containing protein [Rhizobiales bacterium]|nr:DUF971 domain-containing protein [Hyphomicrobiales bacterium]
MTADDIWPTELRLTSDKARLVVAFDNGESYELSAEYLRVMSPSAEVQGHGRDQRVTVPGKRGVRIAGLEPVGNYAVRINFDDRHSTGLYAWKYLRALGREHATRWAEYLAELEEKGLGRD